MPSVMARPDWFSLVLPVNCSVMLLPLAQSLCRQGGGVIILVTGTFVSQRERRRIRQIVHHASPEDAIVEQGIYAISIREIQALGDARPICGVVCRLWDLHAYRWCRKRKLRSVEVSGRRSGEIPLVRSRSENVGHRMAKRIVQVQELLQAENLFPGTNEIDGVIRRGDERALLDVTLRRKGLYRLGPRFHQTRRACTDRSQPSACPGDDKRAHNAFVYSCCLWPRQILRSPIPARKFDLGATTARRQSCFLLT